METVSTLSHFFDIFCERVLTVIPIGANIQLQGVIPTRTK